MIDLPYGSWQIGALPTAGWSSYSVLSASLMRIYLIVALAILAFTAVIIFLIDKIKKTEHESIILARSLGVFLKQTSDFVYYKDSNSRFIFCSQTLADITNHEHWRDMIGKHDFEVFPHDTATIYNEEEKPVFNEGKPLLNKVNPYYLASSEIGYVQTNKWPIFDDNNKVSGIFGISRDITELKNATEDWKRNEIFLPRVLCLQWNGVLNLAITYL